MPSPRSPTSSRSPRSCSSPGWPSAPAPGVRDRRPRRTRLQRAARGGALDAVADARLGDRRPARRRARRARRPAPVAAGDRARLRGRGGGVQPAARLLHLDRDRRPHAAGLRPRARLGAGLRRHACGGQLRLRPGLRGGPAADADAGTRPHARHVERTGDRRAAAGAGRVLPALGASGGRALAAATSGSSARRPRERATWSARRTPTAASARAPGQSSSELYTAWAAIGLAAAGRQPRQMPARDGHYACSTRCGPKPARCRARATSSARSSRCTPAAPRSTRSRAAIRWRGCWPTRAATAPSSTSPT